MDSRKPLTVGELEIDCGAFGKIRRASPPAKGDFAIKDGRLKLLGCIQRGLVTLSREELLPFLDAMDAQDAQIQTLNERIIELDLEAMEKCRRIDSLLTTPPDAELREAVEHIGEVLDNVRCHLGICGPGDDGERKADASDNWGILDALDECRTLLRAVRAPRLTVSDLAVRNVLLSGFPKHMQSHAASEYTTLEMAEKLVEHLRTAERVRDENIQRWMKAEKRACLDFAALLPDDFTESKDWSDSDVAGRIEWLKSRVASLRKAEAERERLFDV